MAASLVSGLSSVATSGKYSDLSGTPTSLKNPTSLTFGSKSYDGSVARTITASDLGALTSHQDISHLLSKTDASSTYQTKITSSSKLAASLVSGLSSVATSGKYDDLIGKPTLLSSFTDDVVSGKYLPLSGGTLTGNLTVNSSLGVGGSIVNKAHYLFARNNDNADWVVTNRNWGSEYTLIHSGNYSSYALPLSGGTMTGGISLSYGTSIKTTENNALIGWADSNVNISSTAYSVNIRSNGTLQHNGNTIWHSGNDGSGSGLDADLLDGKHNGELTAQYFSRGKILTKSDTINKLMSGVYCYINGDNPTGSIDDNVILLAFRNEVRNDMFQLAGAANSINLYYRRAANVGNSYENWTSWEKIAFTSSNVESANKLKNARTIWGQSFDGTGNVSGTLELGASSVRWHNSNSYSISCPTTSVSARLQYHADDGHIFKTAANTDAITILRSGNVGIGTTSPTFKLNVVGSSDWTSYFSANSTNVGVAHASGYGMRIETPSTSSSIYAFRVANTSNTLFTINADGNVGIGTKNPSAKLHILSSAFNILKLTRNDTNGAGIYFSNSNGDLGDMGFLGDAKFVVRNATHDATILTLSQSGNLLVIGGITMYSDQRKKTILGNVELSIKEIANAPLIEHYYNSDERKTTHVGSIAQYWYGLNDWFCKEDSEGYLTMEIQNAALASAISIARELDRYETKTDKTIKQLRKRICQLEEELERLKSA